MNKDEVEVIGYYIELTVLTIPDTVTYEDKTYKVVAICGGAFEKCKSLNKLVFGKNVKAIYSGAFSGCSNLVDVEFNNVETIEYYAFYKCTKIENLVLSDSVKNINSFAFSECKIKTLTTPVSAYWMKVGPIGNIKWDYLQTITLSKGHNGKGDSYKTTSDDYKETPWYNAKNFTTLIIEEGVLELGKATFHSCKNLKSITLGKDAFKGFRFFDSDGVTELSIDAGQLKGLTFSGKKSAMLKQ